MTRGQHLAIDQFKAVSEQNPASIEILEVKTQQTTPNDFCWLRLSLKLGQLTRVSGGLAVRQREQVWIGIHPDFPFRVPVVRVPHKRFANHPHVQWIYTLCLYQAPSTEWDSSDGMFGLLYRLLIWFKAAARNELDPIGAPLHPPVAYTSQDTPQIVPTVNAPQVAEGPWCGWVELETRTNHVRLGEWHSIDQSSAVSAPVAAAILLSAEFPFEYPSEVPDLISLVEKQGISRKFSALLFEGAALHSKKDDPIFVVIGTPMRGIGGADRRLQHLSVWMIDSVGADSLRLACEKYSGVEELREIGKKCEDLFLDWCNIKVKTKWCSVREARPEVLVARDQETNMKVFKGNTVAIWGCGALGSHIAEMLVRAGVSRLILRDNRRVAPGLLCRQLFEENDIGRGKAMALRDRLKRIDPVIDIIAFGKDLLSEPLESESRLEEADLIIDTSANQTVLSKLELRLRNEVVERPAIVSVSISHDAKAGLLCLCQPGYSGGPLDALRRMKIDVTRNPSLNSFADTFWPRESRVDQLFQPEPGCSDPTFSGSSADLMSLSGYLLNQLSISLRGTKSSECSVGLVNFSDLSKPHTRQHYYKRFRSEYCINDPQFGYEIRIDHAALTEIQAWTSRNARQNAAKVETGGLIFGEWDESIQICWVSEVLGPPPDSLHSSEGFVSGIEGTDVVNEEKKNRSRGSVRYIGNWHTHPVSSAFPSTVDLTGMGMILQGHDDTPAKALLLIVGDAMTTPHLGVHVFSRREFSSLGSKGFHLRKFALSPLTFSRPKHDIGLTLSGGGLRAVAFHLGCLRALHDRGILPRLKAISAVSGGSIIAAMYAYESESFDEFDRRVVSLLKEGLTASIAKEMLNPTSVAKSIWSTATVVIPSATRLAISKLLTFMGKDSGVAAGREVRQSFSARSWALMQTLDKKLFSGRRLTDERRNDIDIVFNATELRTGTAFRFGSRESGCWRYGKLSQNDVSLAKVVASSALYPLAFPALDEVFSFIGESGQKIDKRVLLTDGGVYDNLGVSCFEPGRNPDISSNVYSPDYLVVCDAGRGVFTGEDMPSWFIPRTVKSFDTTFRKAHDATISRLSRFNEHGQLKGFVLSYLGQQDNRLPYLPTDLVRLEEVRTYGTALSAMKQEKIVAIAGRGEQLTTILLNHYLPDL